MTTNYVLIDYENVQPANLEILKTHPFKIFVFVGASQKNIVFDLAASLQKFGADAEYIKISGNGQNALDFHIAFYIGQLSRQDLNGVFHIISKDTGFDPLLEHLRSKNIRVYREKDLTEIPVLKISSSTSNDDKIGAVIKNLTCMGQARPRKVKTLSNAINSQFAKKLSAKELDALIKALQSSKHISINKENVSYNLPK